jgi:hypothetical protein
MDVASADAVPSPEASVPSPDPVALWLELQPSLHTPHPMAATMQTTENRIPLIVAPCLESPQNRKISPVFE